MPKRKRQNVNKEYEKILSIGKRAYELREEDEKKWTFAMLADELIPEHSRRKGKAESAITTVKILCKEYKVMIEGGYKEITFP